jgi:hypothetical protein
MDVIGAERDVARLRALLTEAERRLSRARRQSPGDATVQEVTRAARDHVIRRLAALRAEVGGG